MAAEAVDIKKLFEAGAHFGHKTSRWHPKMSQYIHSKKGDNHIIDLGKTVPMLEEALRFIEAQVSAGNQVLLVSTKRQAQELVKQTAEAVNMPYVTNRWLGGMLTNQKTISTRIKRLIDLENRMASGELANKYNKLEVQRFQEEIDSMNVLYGGIKDATPKIGAVFVVDINHDKNAVAEANKLKIPVVALVDTNTDPSSITYPVPCNDDATKAVAYVLEHVQKAIANGQSAQKTKPEDKLEHKEAK